MATRVKFGQVKLGGSNTASCSFGGFSGTPSVTATISGTEKNGATVCIRKLSSSGATFAAFYNGGLELKEGTINWVAIGYTSHRETCGCVPGGHNCLNDVWG